MRSGKRVITARDGVDAFFGNRSPIMNLKMAIERKKGSEIVDKSVNASAGEE